MTIQITPALATAAVQAAAVAFKDKTPSNWEIKPVEGNTEAITAYNVKSLETFEGTVAEFNENLRG